MSVRVDTSALEEQLVRFGTSPYLLTVADDGSPHAVSVRVSFREGGFETRVGPSSRLNAAARPKVTLLWAGAEADDFSLIVDGQAAVSGDRILVEPTAAVLHRTTSRTWEDPAASECKSVFAPSASS